MYVAEPAWSACTTTEPKPVYVSVEPFVPLTVAGPETNEKTTGFPDVPPVAVNVTGASPYVAGVVGCVKVIA